MKKPTSSWITITVISSLAFSPLAHADVGSEAPEATTEQTTEVVAPAQEVVSPQAPYGDLEEVYEFKKCVRKYTRVKMIGITYYNHHLLNS